MSPRFVNQSNVQQTSSVFVPLRVVSFQDFQWGHVQFTFSAINYHLNDLISFS